MNGAELAFPFVETGAMQGESINLGLTKRELFAAMAMQGLLGNHSIIDTSDESSARWVAEHAAMHADTLLAELAKPQEVAP